MAFVGTLTAFTFMRLVGIGLLGEPRSDGARGAHESTAWMTVPIGLLALACALLAIVPSRIVPLFAEAASMIVAGPLPPAPAPLESLGVLDFALAAALVIAALGVARVAPRSTEAPTWDCGYSLGSSRIQYTAQSFSQIVAHRLLPRRLRPRTVRVVPEDLLPPNGRFAADPRDPVTRGVYEPLLERTGQRFANLRWLQQGHLHLYLVYILVIVVLALAWTSLRDVRWS
jgi:NADH:ubiquinone oxidoreductase subunit 5 (subunit L)/multisubunit Na+/H+ antiporter MnhA subunit